MIAPIDARRVVIAAKLLNAYIGTPNLDVFLQNEFKLNKQFGSKDRKFYRELCFSYFRLAAHLPPSVELLTQIVEGKSDFGYSPYSDYSLSNNINNSDLLSWFGAKPPVYIFGNADIRAEVARQFNEASIQFVQHDQYLQCNELVNANIFPIINKLQIMDLGSYSTLLNLPINKTDQIWDACSGAGGKALALQRLYSFKSLFCSDIRASVLQNLARRFANEGWAVKTEVLDAGLAFPSFKPSVILVDAPCTGSGTWRRSPDRARFFDSNTLNKYIYIQTKILDNIIANATMGMLLVYITCSVFEQENEFQVNRLKAQGITCLIQEIIGGHTSNSDYFFRAVFKL